MIIEFIIALAVWDAVKFVFSVVISMRNKEEYNKEKEIQGEVRTFEQRIRKAMEDKESSTN